MTITISDKIAEIAIISLAWIIGAKIVVSLLNQLLAKFSQGVRK